MVEKHYVACHCILKRSDGCKASVTFLACKKKSDTSHLTVLHPLAIESLERYT